MIMEHTVICRHVSKVYRQESVAVQALTDINLEIPKKDFACLSGPSGSGKSTLLNLLGCLDKPSAGEFFLGDDDVAQMTDDQLSYVRASRIGFVFQS